MKWLLILSVICLSCASAQLYAPASPPQRLSGSEFYRTVAAFNWKQRDSLAIKELLSGNIPDFLRKLVEINVTMFDSASGQIVSASYFVTPDYLSLGSSDNWARVCITPMAAQQVADSFHCFLPTRKMVDQIYAAAPLKLEPMPMFAFRDSSPTMYQHHLIIEGQRQGRKGLIAGIKKDVVISGRISRDSRGNRLAIYGWHQLNGKPIQPLYTGHVSWWVDYSQAIRLVYRKIKLNGKWMDYTDVLRHPIYRKLICDEEYCDFYAYPF